MLKKVLSAVLSISVVCSVISVPVFAEFTEEPVVITIIDENFDGLSGTDLSASKATQLSESKVYYTAPNAAQSYGYGASGVSIEAKETDGKDKAFKVLREKTNGNYAQPQIWFKPDANVVLDGGDKLHISFDYKMGEGSNGQLFALIGDEFNMVEEWTSTNNDKYNGTNSVANRKFTPLDSTFAGNKVNGDTYPNFSNTLVTFENSGLSFGNQAAKDSASSAQLTDWVNVDILIDTDDKKQGGGQTITETFTYADGSKKIYYATYDANYKDADDTDITPMTEFGYFKFRSVNQTSESDTYYLDNVKIEKIGTAKKYYTASIKNLIDCDFSGLSYQSKLGVGNRTPETISVEDRIYFRQSYGNEGTGEIVSVEKDGKTVNAFKQSVNVTGQGESHNMLGFKSPEGKVDIKEGDILRFSYDLMNETIDNASAVNYRFSPMLNMPRYNTGVRDTSGDEFEEYETTYLDVDTATSKVGSPAYGDGFLLEAWETGLHRYCGRSHWGAGLDNQTIANNAWHHYEFVINTADKAKDGKQTMKIYIDDSQVLYGTLDNNVTNGQPDKYEYFTALEMCYYYQGKGASHEENHSIYSTNYKLDIITPGFGVSGAAIEDNDPADGITLTPGTMRVTCAFNLPGSLKKKNETEKHKINVYAAQYDEEERLIHMDLLPYEYTEYDSYHDFDIEVLRDAKKVKLISFDENLVPLVVSTSGDVVPVEARQISFALNPEEVVGLH